MDIDESVPVWPPRCKGDSYYLTPKHSCELNCEELSYFVMARVLHVVPGGLVTDHQGPDGYFKMGGFPVYEGVIF